VQPETPQGETPVVTEPKTNANPAPQVPDPEVERLRKEAEQQKMRANQLENQLKAKEDAEAAAEAKQLEEQNKYKELYEKSEAEKAALKEAQDKREQEAALKAEQAKVFAEFPDEVRSLAEEVGLNLTDTDEDTVAEFKAKLDKISTKIKAPKVTANNPGNPPSNVELTNLDFHAIAADPVKFAEYMAKNSKGVAQMMRPQA
jgi:membrane protein involved in colicin uptake